MQTSSKHQHARRFLSALALLTPFAAVGCGTVVTQHEWDATAAGSDVPNSDSCADLRPPYIAVSAQSMTLSGPCAVELLPHLREPCAQPDYLCGSGGGGASGSGGIQCRRAPCGYTWESIGGGGPLAPPELPQMPQMAEIAERSPDPTR